MPGAWHNLSIDETLERLGTASNGLSKDEAHRRLEKYGPNELVKTRRTSALKLFLEQFSNTLVIILIIAAVVSAVLGEWIDAAVILLIVFLNAILGFLQQYKAERALDALKTLAAPRCLVVRDGEETSLQAREIVPGDVVMLNAGDRVPADLRLIETSSLRVNEAPLTGESVPVSKTTASLPGEVFLGDRKNMAFLGCTVEVGRGRGVVAATGMSTELGKIADLVQAEPEVKTPLQKQLDRLGKQLGAVILAMVIIIFAIEYLINQGSGIVDLFLTSVSLAVAAIPEGLPAVVTVSLALGIQRMIKRNALIRRLPAVETLGSATVICTDKTGTLTRGEMNVVAVLAGNIGFSIEGEGFDPRGRILHAGQPVNLAASPELGLLLKASMLCSDATVKQGEKGWTVVGDTTEGALIVAAMRAGLDRSRLEEGLPRVSEIPFTSERKMMSTVHAPIDTQARDELKKMPEAERLAILVKTPGKTLFVKGAPERVLKVCTRIMTAGNAAPITDDDRAQLIYKNQEMASRGLRVLGLACRELPDGFSDFTEQGIEKDLTFLGFAGMIDAPRRDAIEALKHCKKAGIRVVMITGDHKLTAMAVAAEMGILSKHQKAMTGEELSKLSENEFLALVEDVRVYARVSPEDKLRILKAWKKKGHVVAMTGDGVNDAPALRSSDLGIAMGITGTDVAKESSDMVLTDDNFASIVGAVEEGRAIYLNIRKFVRYLLSTNTGEVMTIFVAAILLLPLPLVPLQILWINLITDGLPAVALGVEPKEKGLMDRKPRDPRKGILSGGMALAVIWVGSLMMLGSLALFTWALQTHEIDYARTLVFYTLTMFQMFNVLAIRVEGESVFKAGFFKNRMLILAVLSTIILQFVVMYLPALQGPFGTVALPLGDLAIATALASLAFFGVEIEKTILNRRRARIPVGEP